MANLPETPQWEEGIYQIEVSDPVLGGPDGISNRQGKQLASRTLYLKQQVEKGGTDLAKHIAAADPHTQYAPKASPTFTGTPTAPTPANSDNSKKLATTEFVAKALAALAGSAPKTLDTLKELADALGNDPNFATTVLNKLAEKLAKDQNGADIPDPALFVKNLGLGGIASLRQATFTASGSWTCPAGVTQISIDACGGGGGGAGGASGGTGGGGGGGAAAVIGRKITVVPGTVYTVTIGTGGAGGTTNSAPGGVGGTTSLGTLLSLPGGVGGTRATTGGGGAAGGEGGLPGYDGYYSSSPSVSVAGAGGGCLLGAGGAGGATSQIGCKPGQFGGGGGGGAGQAVTGGDGAGGFMRITW